MSMSSAAPLGGVPGSHLWAGRILTGIAVLFLLIDGVSKLLRVQPVLDSIAQLGYPLGSEVTIGAILLCCLALYLIPQTAVLGAVLLTGYLGGAVATNFRLSYPLFSHILFPVYIGLTVWGGLYFRDTRVRALLPFRTGRS